MAKDVNTDLEAALEAAASEEETDESSPSAEDKETEALATEVKGEDDKTKPDTKRGHKGANNRIQDLLGKVEETEGKIGEIEETVAARDTEIQRLLGMLELRDNDAAVVAKINDPRKVRQTKKSQMTRQ